MKILYLLELSKDHLQVINKYQYGFDEQYSHEDYVGGIKIMWVGCKGEIKGKSTQQEHPSKEL